EAGEEVAAGGEKEEVEPCRLRDLEQVLVDERQYVLLNLSGGVGPVGGEVAEHDGVAPLLDLLQQPQPFRASHDHTTWHTSSRSPGSLCIPDVTGSAAER